LWYLLASHPEAQERLAAELDGAPWEGHPTIDMLPNYPYTRSVIDEVLREGVAAAAVRHEPAGNCDGYQFAQQAQFPHAAGDSIEGRPQEAHLAAHRINWILKEVTPFRSRTTEAQPSGCRRDPGLLVAQPAQHLV
jgi:hypothetical protein